MSLYVSSFGSLLFGVVVLGVAGPSCSKATDEQPSEAPRQSHERPDDEQAPAASAPAAADREARGTVEPGAASAEEAQADTTPTAKAEAPAAAACPAAAGVVTVETEEIPGGIAIVFHAGSDGDVASLRTHVRRMADRHNRRRPSAGSDAATPSRRQGRGPAGAPFVGTQANTEPIPDGIRLLLRPAKPKDVQQLRTQIRTRVEDMQPGRCPMHTLMHGMRG